MGVIDDEIAAEAAKPKKKQTWPEYMTESATDASAKFLDTISFGGLPALRDKIAQMAGVEQPSAVEEVKQAEERSPWATGAGQVAGYALPVGGVASGITQGVAKFAPKLLPFMKGFVGKGATEGVSSGIVSGVDEASRYLLSGGQNPDGSAAPPDPIDPQRIAKDIFFGTILGGGTTALTNAFSPSRSLGTRLPATRPGETLPTTAKDPTGILEPGVPVSGPESLKLSGRPGPAREAQSILEDLSERAPSVLDDQGVAQSAATRDLRLDTARTRLTAEEQAANAALRKGGPLLDERIPNVNRNLPPGARDVPGAPVKPGSKESFENLTGRLERLREDQILRPSAERAADIAALEGQLGNRVPVYGAAEKAAQRGTSFDEWRQNLPVERLPVPEPAKGAGEWVSGLLRGIAPKTTAALRSVEGLPGLLQGQSPILRPGKTLETVLDPAQLGKALQPEDWLKVLLGTAGRQGSRHAFTEYVNTKSGGRNKPIKD